MSRRRCEDGKTARRVVSRTGEREVIAGVVDVLPRSERPAAKNAKSLKVAKMVDRPWLVA